MTVAAVHNIWGDVSFTHAHTLSMFPTCLCVRETQVVQQQERESEQREGIE